MNDSINFGQYLRGVREAKKISLRKFAEKVGKTPTYISKIERNELGTKPSEELVKRIAEELNLDFDDLIILAGRIPEEIPNIINERPQQMTALLRTAKNLSNEELQKFMIKMNKQGAKKDD